MTLPRRDTYHDYTPMRDLRNALRPLTAETLITLKIDSLCRRAGGNVTGNAYYRVWEDPRWECILFEVFFDSSSWTGHDGRSPVEIVTPLLQKALASLRHLVYRWARQQRTEE